MATDALTVKVEFDKENAMNCIKNVLMEEYGMTLDELAELCKAKQEGRLFMSDVALGGEVYYVPTFNGKPYCGVKSGHVQAVAFTKAGKRVKIREHHAHNQDFMLGKTVFLDRESAEAKLKEEQRDV